MKFFIALWAFVGLVAAGGVHKKDTNFADREFLAKQKFLLEIVYRVEDPLVFEAYIKLGTSFTYNKNDYLNHDDYAEYMDNYYKAHKYGVTLPKGEFFAATVPSHSQQLSGLFSFFYYAKNWEVFQRNVCWARLHANEAMFIHALTLAVTHRDDFHGLILPTIYEIFPQYFLNSKFVYEAEKFDYDVWSKYTMQEKQYKDVMYMDYNKYFKKYNNYNYFYTKDWKMWQWWKLMGLGEHWYREDRFIMRDNIEHVKKDSIFIDMMKDTKIFWMPVDYTRDVELYNQESQLSYFTEDLEWNALWYYFNMDYAPFLQGDDFGLNKDRRGEYWLFTMRQMLCRYQLERNSHRYGEIPEFSFLKAVEYGYDPQLIHYNGVGFSYRKNYYEFESHGNFEYLHKVLDFFRRVEDILTQGYYTLADGKVIDMRRPEAVEYLGGMLQGNADTFDKYFATFWSMYAHMYVAEVEEEHTNFVYPNIFLNYETMMRDPIFYMVYKKISNVFYHFHRYIEPYTKRELLLPGVTIKDVRVSELVTYFDLFDYDVTNLLNDQMTFVDGEFVWDKSLLARQMRLNHKPFEFDFTIKSDQAEKVVVRTFLAPKYDEFDRVISLSENRENFMQMDAFIYDLSAGMNNFKYKSPDLVWTIDDRITYTELYKYVMLAYEGKYELPLDCATMRKTTTHCGFPDRLVLPRGWHQGMPMQFFFFVAPFHGDSQEHFSSESYSTFCDIGSGVRHLGEDPLGYPFDREINEYEFFVPNMFFKDVKIYHVNTFEKYYNHKYENFGSFDYNYTN